MSELTSRTKAHLYDLTRAEVRGLIAGMVAREIIHLAAGVGVGIGPDDEETIETFIDSWQPVAFLVNADAAHLVDVERAGEVACGYAWDLGAAQAELERMRERLARHEGEGEV